MDYSTRILAMLNVDHVGTFSEGIAPVFQKDGVGFIDKTGVSIVPVGTYENIDFSSMVHMRYEFRNGLSAVVKDGRCGFINRVGDIVIPPEYDTVSPFTEGFAAARFNGKWGFINQFGKPIVPFEYDFVQPFREGLACVHKNKNISFIDVNGNETINLGNKFIIVNPFHEGVAGVMMGRGKMPEMFPEENESKKHFLERLKSAVDEISVNEKWGFIDTAGNIILPLEYSFLSQLYEGIAVSIKNGRRAYIDRFGKNVLEVDFEQTGCFIEGLASIRRDGKYGCIDKSGRLVIAPIYDNDMSIIFNEGFAPVKRNGKWGYIDREGEIVIPFEYDEALPISEGLAVARKNVQWEIIQVVSQTASS